ncbi:uncharacterized protein UTRI_00415 [Ustilago trichophora]|uniref:MIT domain-containing protein n=1 Tax=Ustilago trichophora TaxID=86804 RepID=A0A5C3DRK5_9BASI|nr:uncharacterized protein UTRI_00415 [Ustilago trichophora]
MAQPASYSMPRSGGETSFLSFDDAPNSPNPGLPADAYTAQPLQSMSTSYASSNTGGVAAMYQREQPGSPDSSARASGSSRASPSKTSRLTNSQPDSSKDLAAAAFADASEASNRYESLHSSPPRATGKRPSSRGSRLGALLGRSLPSTDTGHSRDASASTNQTEGTSSNDSSFFGRRNRTKASPVHEDIDEATDSKPAASSSSSSRLFSANSQKDAARSASAMGMLDFKPDVPKSDSNDAADDSRSGKTRPTRPSSQSNLLDTITGGSVGSSSLSGAPSSSNAPQQTRGGRLGRLAYKKEDSIAYIAQSRNASQQMAAGTRNSNTEEAGHQQQHWTASSAFAGTRGLGIEDLAGSYVSERAANLPPGSMDTRAYAHPSAYRYAPDYSDGPEHTASADAGVGVASTSAHTQSGASSSNTSSRAPSVAGTHGGNYHNRFSRQGLSQQLAQDTSHDSETRATHSSTDTPTAVVASSRSSYERGGSSPRGTLSDAAIAALGAMPGASAGSLLNANGAPLSSKNILTIALQKAQNAVQLDSANNVPEAIAAYKQAVRLLEEVMERIAPRTGKRSRPSREEERRRLRVIHDTYADRIRLLSMIYSPEDLDAHDETTDTSFSSNAQPAAATKADWLERVRDDSQEDPAIVTPRLNGDHLDPNAQHSPRDDTRSFLSITPVRSTFPSSSSQTPTQPQQPSQSQHPWPRSPPMPSAPLSPPLDSSPRRRVRNDVRPGSRGSRGSRASISLSIADEQEAQDYRIPPPAIAEEMPRISIEATTVELSDVTATSPKKEPKEPLRDAAAQIREVEALTQQHGRSDSDSSYQSTTTGGRLKPTALPHRAFGLEDEVRTPVTSYFDATGDMGLPDERASGGAISPLDVQARQQKLSLTSASKPPAEAVISERPAEKPVKMGLAQRARALSFKGPLLRQKASMPALGDRKKEDMITANGAATPKGQAHRPGSADSPSTEATSTQRTGSRNNDHPTPWDIEEGGSNITVRPGSNRPRASTASALVSATTSAGTISQRRKNAHVVQGLTDELEELGMMEEPEGGIRGGSVAMSSRQRSTSQPGSRRPSIPAAFLAANANASGGGLPSTLGNGTGANGEHLPPPVPDLARTLSALELRRSGDAKAAVAAAAAASAGAGGDVSFATSNGADLSISSLAMPLPRPIWDPSSSADAESSSNSAFLITDIFPSGLPSLAAGAPSYATTTTTITTSYPSSTLPIPPHPLLKPFYTITQLHASILSGAQITPRLFIPRTLWRQPGVKLVSVETKVKAIEALLTSLDSVAKGGEALLMPLGSGAGLETSNASRFVRCLEEWEVVLVEVQNSLSKKLPFVESFSPSSSGAGGVTGGAGGGGGTTAEGKDGLGGKEGKNKGFGSGFGSRFLTRGLDRMTGGVGQAKALDATSMGVYIDALTKLFARCSVLATHLTWVLIADSSIPPSSSPSFSSLPPSNATTTATATAMTVPIPSPTTAIGTAHANRTAYFALPPQLRANIQARLKRSSEFMAKVVVAFVLQDLGVLVEKSVKKGSSMFVD